MFVFLPVPGPADARCEGTGDCPSVESFPYVVTELGDPTGRNASVAFGINEKGAVVGQAGSRAFLYVDGVMQILPTLDGRETAASAIDERGVVVGYSGNNAFI